MGWIQDLYDPKLRKWEEFYRNRWQYDRVVRSTHGVNCTGGCSWNVYVKDGIVVWELQALDYPSFSSSLPPYEPRGCQRGISFSWYLYSPLRVKYPYIRGTLIDIYRDEKSKIGDPVLSWASIMEDNEKRKRILNARGKGGFRRASWEESTEIICASIIYAIKKYGPDRIIGFSPIPAMSMLSYAGGSRFLQLLGGVNLSFYDWYCDLPPASPEIWGEQTDVCESADWYNSKFIAICGTNLSMTRTPDVHFVAEGRHNGTKLVVFSPDFSQVSKYADWWIPVKQGEDSAFWMAVNHVILKEYHYEKKSEYFLDYIKKYTDAPFLVKLVKDGDSYNPDILLRANKIEKYKDVENGDWKFLVFDKITNSPKMPKGSIGFRWQKKNGEWNLELKDGFDGSPIDPILSFLDISNEKLMVNFYDFTSEKILKREVPVKFIETKEGKIPVATIYDLLFAQFGVSRGLKGDWPVDYNDDLQFTPSWQEKYTKISRETLIQFAREWASTAEKTSGKCMVIIGPGLNHWYHNNLIYRSCIVTLMLTGCIGKNGGGLNHYVGQEKLAPIAPWATLAFALDWIKPPRLQNAPSFHYVHSGQWRYEKEFTEYHPVPLNSFARGHTIDMQVKAVKNGWLPFYPQFNKNPLEIAKEAEKEGKKTKEEIVQYIIEKLKEKKLKFSIEDPDAEENWPRVFIIWRGNALMSSAKGHEFFLKHYLGTHTNAIAEEVVDEESVKEVVLRKAPEGKFDLIVDINFRMDTSALYSDIVLPAATWYEKNDLNSTDLHSFIHPLSEAVPPCWEAKSDWEIFKLFAKKISELASRHLPNIEKDIVMAPLMHDTPAEIAQPELKDWSKGEIEAIPGKSMPNFVVVERDYVNLYNRFISYGPRAKSDGIGFHGINWKIDDIYDEMVKENPIKWNGEVYPSINDVVEAANNILRLAPETNSEISLRAYKAEEEHTGLKLTDLCEDFKGIQYTFEDLLAQPRRLLNSPIWSGLMNKGRAYAPYCLNVEKLVPWRTLTGRQHFYLDHRGYISFGENLPTYKPLPHPSKYRDLVKTKKEEKSLVLNYLTPHGKWHIHSTYFDNLRMLTLSRGCEPCWINDKDAEEVGINDNDWVEIFNDNGVMVTRAAVSARIPRGVCIVYHSPERTISVPKAPVRLGRRAGGHNSLTRIRLKPNLMMGGYGQFTYAFNYWGPTGVNRDTYVIVRKLQGKVEW